MTDDEAKIVRDVTEALVGTKYDCDNCAGRWEYDELRYIAHYNERVGTNGPFPDGECPHCGALCYEVKT